MTNQAKYAERPGENAEVRGKFMCSEISNKQDSGGAQQGERIGRLKRSPLSEVLFCGDSALSEEAESGDGFSG